LFVDGGVGFNNPTLVADQLIKEAPFEYESSEDLIVVSLGTGGNLYEMYFNSFWGRAALVTKAVTECKTTAATMYNRYTDNKHCATVKYHRFDPDAVGRYAIDDATALNTVQNEVGNWCNPTVHRELQLVAEYLAGAANKT
jgi:hypothetical protein